MNVIQFLKEQKIEFIFHDNVSDNSDLFDDVDRDVFRYFYVKKELTMSENFTRAIECSSGSFILMTGDDDFILPEIINVAKYLQNKNLAAATSSLISYLWPTVSSKIAGANKSGLCLFPRKNREIALKKTSHGLKSILFQGGAFFNYEIPSPYQSLIKKSVIENIMKNYKTCFPGFSPDISSAIAVASNIDKFVRWDKPFVVSGASPGSGAAEGFAHMHMGDLESRSYIVDNIDQWPQDVPKIFCGQTIYAASTSISVNQFCAEKLEQININYLYAALIVFNRKLAWRHVRPKVKLKSVLPIFFYSLTLICKRIFNLFQNVFINKKFFLINKYDNLQSLVLLFHLSVKNIKCIYETK